MKEPLPHISAPLKNSSTADLEALRIINPCPKSWAEMKGNDQKRFCEHCHLHVHNLSEMTPRQIRGLAQTPGRRCVAYVELADGKILTRQRFASFRRPLARGVRLLASLLALIFPFSFVGCATKNSSTRTENSHIQTNLQTAQPAPGEAMAISTPKRGTPVPLLGTPIAPPPTPSKK